MREIKDISQELEWMQMEEHQPESAATDTGRAGTDALYSGAEFFWCSG